MTKRGTIGTVSNRQQKNDQSNGYEAVADAFMHARNQSPVGVATVRAWARSLAPGAAVLDLGCGSGEPIASALCDEGLTVYGIDASPSMTAAFVRRLPQAQIACETIEDSNFFARRFDGVLAIGLIFLLPDQAQQNFIHKVATALNPDGRFLFTAPTQVCTWIDMLTGNQSYSLGAERYRMLCDEVGLTLIGEYQDEGENHYYDMRLSHPESPDAE